METKASLTFNLIGANGTSGPAFTINIPDNVTFFNISKEDIRDAYTPPAALEATFDDCLSEWKFYKVSPKNLNCPINETSSDDYDELEDRLTTIDYNGLTVKPLDGKLDFFCSAMLTEDSYGAKIVRNLNVEKGKCVGGSKELREFYGNINIDGSSIRSEINRVVLLFSTAEYILKAVGDLNIENVYSFTIFNGNNLASNGSGAWFNVLDLRHVDTSTCKIISVLAFCNTPCTLILGNFSNESVTSSDFMHKAPKHGMKLVFTGPPPTLKNCGYNNGVPKNLYKDTYDWVRTVNPDIIYVPLSYIDEYNENTTAKPGSNEDIDDFIGNTGWSYYGGRGGYFIDHSERKITEDYGLFVGYNPETQFLPKKEGVGANAKTVWLYRAPNRP